MNKQLEQILLNKVHNCQGKTTYECMKNIKSAKKAILEYMEREKIEARLDELKVLLNEEEDNGIGFRSAVKSDVIHQRLFELEAQRSKLNGGKDD